MGFNSAFEGLRHADFCFYQDDKDKTNWITASDISTNKIAFLFTDTAYFYL